jgi:hypothetical protein
LTVLAEIEFAGRAQRFTGQFDVYFGIGVNDGLSHHPHICVLPAQCVKGKRKGLLENLGADRRIAGCQNLHNARGFLARLHANLGISLVSVRYID